MPDGRRYVLWRERRGSEELIASFARLDDLVHALRTLSDLPPQPSYWLRYSVTEYEAGREVARHEVTWRDGAVATLR